jgi:hypothetical protein
MITRTDIINAQQIEQERCRQMILECCDYNTIINNVHLKAAMGF